MILVASNELKIMITTEKTWWKRKSEHLIQNSHEKIIEESL